MIIKNIYGAPIMIPFGDFTPKSIWAQTSDGEVIVVDSIGSGVPNTRESFGIFSKEGFQKLLTGLQQFEQDYEYSEIIYKWMPRGSI